jgi:hypothetical protein
MAISPAWRDGKAGFEFFLEVDHGRMGRKAPMK